MNDPDLFRSLWDLDAQGMQALPGYRPQPTASPEGMTENSPPFQRRVGGGIQWKSPQGTNEPYNSLAMSHVYASVLAHVVFRTKNRECLISERFEPELWAYIGGIARANKFKALIVGGMPDHIHALLSLPPVMSIAKAVQLIKGGSSKWINDQSLRRSFAWQDGYGVFTIGVSQVNSTIRYIRNQKRHHAKLSFPDELSMILRRHGLTLIDR